MGSHCHPRQRLTYRWGGSASPRMEMATPSQPAPIHPNHAGKDATKTPTAGHGNFETMPCTLRSANCTKPMLYPLKKHYRRDFAKSRATPRTTNVAGSNYKQKRLV